MIFLDSADTAVLDFQILDIDGCGLDQETDNSEDLVGRISGILVVLQDELQVVVDEALAVFREAESKSWRI